MLCLWLHIIICLVQYQTGFSFMVNNTRKNHLCHEEESQSLLQLRELVSLHQEYEVHPRCYGSYSKPLYWDERRDCCLWDSVTCDKHTGHVVGLDLSCSGLSGKNLSNSTLFRLTHLRNLNLAYNPFFCDIPFKLGRLNSLTHLNLSISAFGGHIPVEFYHLSNLVSLDITTYYKDPTLYCDHIKTLFGNMTKLRVVLLRGVNISSALPLNMSSFLTHLNLEGTGMQGNLPASIFDKPNLQFLHLQMNFGLTGSLPSFNRSNVWRIEQLIFWGTSISGRLPESIGFMTNLNYLVFTLCKLSGPIPDSIGNLTQITQMYLPDNDLSGKIPSTISNLRQLSELNLAENHLQGQLPDAFSDLQNLGGVDISSNALTGQLPSSLTNMSQLQLLDLSSNKLTGLFPSRAADGLKKLSKLVLSNNSIQGTVPSWLLNLPSLQSVDISSNRLTGGNGNFNSETLRDLDLSNNQLGIKIESFYNLSQIESLKLSNNRLIEQGHEFVNVTLPNLSRVELSSCEIKEFPHLLRNLSGLNSLDLSNNKIQGPIPSWFRSPLLTFLNISLNYLTHAPLQQLESINFLDLHSNSLQDSFPPSICNMSVLQVLDLSSNKLRGTIPECIGNFTYRLEVLDLRRNELHGKIPTAIGNKDSALAFLGLSANHLEGSLPPSLANLTQLQVLDIGNNKIQGTFPWWLQNLTSLTVLILKSNRFQGSISLPASSNSFIALKIIDLSYNNFTGSLPKELFTRLQAMIKQEEVYPGDLYMGSGTRWYLYSMLLSVKGADIEFTRVLRIFTTIDLSSNHFQGTIPESFKDLILLRLLNLSHNNFSGSIPRALGSMTKLEQLDLSSNQLGGGIPQTLTNLTFLAVLNLSHNHLVGPIPKGNQFSTFSNESYVGNSGLCGDPMTTSCGGEPPSLGVFDDDDEEEDGFMMGFTWKTVVVGYSCGILLGFILGNVMIFAQKPKWLTRFVYTEAAIILKRRKKRAARTVLRRG